MVYQNVHFAQSRVEIKSIRYQSKNGKFENGGIKETGMSDYFTHTAFFVEKAATPEYMSEMCGKSAIETQSCICCELLSHLSTFSLVSTSVFMGPLVLRHQKMFLLPRFIASFPQEKKTKIGNFLRHQGI